jgi:hypothetical protein
MGTHPATEDISKDQTSQSPPTPRVIESKTNPMTLPSNKNPDPVVTALNVLNSGRLRMLPKPPGPELPLLREADILHWIEEYEATKDYEFLGHPDFPLEVLKLQLATFKVELEYLQITIEELEDKSDTEDMEADHHEVENCVNSLDVELDEQEEYVD